MGEGEFGFGEGCHENLRTSDLELLYMYSCENADKDENEREDQLCFVGQFHAGTSFDFGFSMYAAICLFERIAGFVNEIIFVW